jgi:hypothetical protein
LGIYTGWGLQILLNIQSGVYSEWVALTRGSYKQASCWQKTRQVACCASKRESRQKVSPFADAPSKAPRIVLSLKGLPTKKPGDIAGLHYDY